MEVDVAELWLRQRVLVSAESYGRASLGCSTTLHYDRAHGKDWRSLIPVEMRGSVEEEQASKMVGMRQ